MPLFQRRHYDLLVWWAGNNLDLKTLPSLLTLLADDNPAFQKHRFAAAFKTHRDAVDAYANTAKVTRPTLIEANLDDVLSHSEE